MKNCNRCGNELNDNAIYCPKCNEPTDLFEKVYHEPSRLQKAAKIIMAIFTVIYGITALVTYVGKRRLGNCFCLVDYVHCKFYSRQRVRLPRFFLRGRKCAFQSFDFDFLQRHLRHNDFGGRQQKEDGRKTPRKIVVYIIKGVAEFRQRLFVTIKRVCPSIGLTRSRYSLTPLYFIKLFQIFKQIFRVFH